MAEIGRHAVRDVEGGARNAEKPPPQRQAGAWQPVAVEKEGAIRLAETRSPAPGDREPERRIAQGAGHIDALAGAGAGAQEGAARLDLAEGGDGDRQGTGCRGGIAAEERDLELPLIFRQPTPVLYAQKEISPICVAYGMMHISVRRKS